jgi:hypothetical protein
VLDEAGEAVGDAGGAAAVEAKDILVEVSLQVLVADRTVVGAHEPALGEAEDEMDGGQAQAGLTPGAAEDDGLMGVALGVEAGVAGPAVAGDGGRPGDVLAETSGTTAKRSRPSRRPRALPRPLSTAPATLALPRAPRPPGPGLAAPR